MFSNNSVKLDALKNRFLMTAKALHSIRMCLTVQVVWHVKHCGCGSCFSMKAWVSLVWPIRNRDITTCSLLDALKAGLHSPKVGWIWKSLLLLFMSHRCCHFLWRIASLCFRWFSSQVFNSSDTLSFILWIQFLFVLFVFCFSRYFVQYLRNCLRSYKVLILFFNAWCYRWLWWPLLLYLIKFRNQLLSHLCTFLWAIYFLLAFGGY